MTKSQNPSFTVRPLTFKLLFSALVLTQFNYPEANGAEPAPAHSAQTAGKTLFVSKLGDNSDGSSWAKAFKTVQAALNAVPDDRGGHRIIVRPDT